MRLTKMHYLLAVTPLLGITAPANAHFNGGHELGVMDGLFHFLIEPAHVMLLVPAIIVLLVGLGKMRTHIRLLQYITGKRQRR
jgi:hypothetical protein